MRYSGTTLLILALLLACLVLAFLMSALPAQAAIASEVTIERFVYSGQVTGQYDEYVKICNISGSSVDLGEMNPWRMGDEESATSGGSSTEGMYELSGTLSVGNCFIIASNANAFSDTWAFLPDYEMRPVIGVSWDNNESVPNLVNVFGTWRLADAGDNITLWKYSGGSYVQHDEAAYGTASDRYSEVGLSTTADYQISCSGNAAVTRNGVSTDTDNMYADFNCTDNPNAVTLHLLTTDGGSAGVVPLIVLLSILGAVGGGMLAYRRRILRVGVQQLN